MKSSDFISKYVLYCIILYYRIAIRATEIIENVNRLSRYGSRRSAETVTFLQIGTPKL